MKSNPLKNDDQQSLQNELRPFRLKAGLSQGDLSALLGYPSDATVSRHELSRSLPPLFIALCYEIILRVPVSQIFVGIKDRAECHVEKRILQFEADLESSSSSDQAAALPEIAHKLAWLADRRNSKDEFNA
jgi:DNA-binding XRE family transcriptional regulator